MPPVLLARGSGIPTSSLCVIRVSVRMTPETTMVQRASRIRFTSCQNENTCCTRSDKQSIVTYDVKSQNFLTKRTRRNKQRNYATSEKNRLCMLDKSSAPAVRSSAVIVAGGYSPKREGLLTIQQVRPVPGQSVFEDLLGPRTPSVTTVGAGDPCYRRPFPA